VPIRRPLSVLIATLALAACGSPVPSGTPASTATASPASTGAGETGAPSGAPSTQPSPSPSLATLLLKVTNEGGFINPASTLAALPTVAVYADGRILVPGPVDASLPGGLVAPLVVRSIGPSGSAQVLAAIRSAGLDKAATNGPGIPGDSGTTVFTVVIDGTTTVTHLAGGGPPGPGGPGAQGSADPGRAAAFALLDRLLDATDTWGAPPAQETAYVPTGYRIFVAPGAPETQIKLSPIAWPLVTPLDAFGTSAVPDRGIAGLRQGVALGDDAAKLAPLFKTATSATPFTSGGKAYTLFVRPLLPDEAGG
jgi:hypothetical protein